MKSVLSATLAIGLLLQGVECKQPNIIFLLADDLGFGDVDVCPDTVPYEQCPLRPTKEGRKQSLHTPRLKKMGAEGQIMTNWYSPRSICSPSRQAMLTGRDPIFFASISNFVRIFASSSSRGGLPTGELSMANYLKDAGYATGYTGKYHAGMTNGTDPLGHTPVRFGFDEVMFFVGGSNGEACHAGVMNPPGDDNIYHMCTFSNVMNGATGEVLEQPIRWENVSGRALEESINFIEKHGKSDKPFFLLHAFTQVHIPWNPARYFVSSTVNHVWADMVSEVDWATGVVFDTIKKLGIENDTVVVFGSDNGPYMESTSSWCPQNCNIQKPSYQKAGGPEGFGCTPCDDYTVSLPGPYKGGKGNLWEGGVHTAGIWWGPGRVAPGKINPTVMSGLDLLPTFASMANGGTFTPKDGRHYDGRDISQDLLNPPDLDSVPTGDFTYWCGTQVLAVRQGRYKTFFKSQDFVGETKEDPVAKNMCALTGECCFGSPSRLCSCDWATNHDMAPVVFDLMDNLHEDMDKALDDALEATQQIILDAMDVQHLKLGLVINERCAWQTHACEILDKAYPGVRVSKVWKDIATSDSEKLADNPDFVVNVGVIRNMTRWITSLPNQDMVDMCFGDHGQGVGSAELPFYKEALGRIGCQIDVNSPLCPVTPQGCQMEMYEPYDNCSIRTPQGPTCANRRPCGQQPGYLGPFEFVNPGPLGGNESWCGCFKHPSGNSYFPARFAQSVCDWQNLVDPNHTWCRPPPCATKETDATCEAIHKYGLNNVPTGEIWNEPYPDDQHRITSGPVNITTGLDSLMDIPASQFTTKTGGMQLWIAAAAGLAMALVGWSALKTWKSRWSPTYRSIVRVPAESMLTTTPEGEEPPSAIQSL